jgi:hypothetical protein
MTDYQRNRIQVLGAKIEQLSGQQSFVKQHLKKLIGIGLSFSFGFPFYSGSHHDYTRYDDDTVIERAGVGYFEMVGYNLLGYTVFCVLAHFVYTIQTKMELKNLTKQLKQIEAAIAADI